MTALPEKSLRRLFLDGMFWLTTVRLLSQLISWAITLYVIRILSPSDYGLMAMATVYVSFIILFNEVGLSAAIVQKKDLAQKDLSNICWAVLLVNAALYLLAVFTAPALAAFYSEPRLTEIVRVAAIVFLVRSVSVVPYNVLAREMAFHKQSQAELAAGTSGAVATLLLALGGHGVWSLVYGSIVGEIARSLLLFAFHPWRPQFSFSISETKELVNFGFKVAVARVFWYLYSNMDLMFAGRVLGKTQLGYYAIAVQLALIPLDKLISAVSHVAFPAFSRVQDDPALLRRHYLRIVGFVAFASFPACWGIFLIAESIVPLFLSEKWLPAVLPLQILSVVTAFRAVHLVNTPLEMALGRPDVTVRNFALITLTLAVSFFVGASYGLKGLAYSWMVFPVVFLITTWITLKLVGLSLGEYCKELRHPFLGSAFMVAVVLTVQRLVLVDHGSAAQVAGSVALGLVTYVAYYALFNRGMFLEVRNILRR